MSYVPPHRRGKEAGSTPAKLADIVERTSLSNALSDVARGAHRPPGEGGAGGWGARSCGAGAGGCSDTRSGQDGRHGQNARSAQDARFAHDARAGQHERAHGEEEGGRAAPRARGGGDWAHGGGAHGLGGHERSGGGCGGGRGSGGGRPSAPRRFGSVEAERSQGGLKWSAGGNSTVELLDGATCVDDLDGQRMIYQWPSAVAAAEPRGVYFQDRRRQYAFACAGAGCELLGHLAAATTPMLVINAQLLREAARALSVPPEALLAEGERLYADKPNLKARARTRCAAAAAASLGRWRQRASRRRHRARRSRRPRRVPASPPQTRGGGTWSDAEYGHAGLQGTYLRLKSVQRFTEAWALCERAAARGAFSERLLRAPSVRVVSIGGGPGFELLAFDLFFRWLRDCARLRAQGSAQAHAPAAAAAHAPPPPAAPRAAQSAAWADRSDDEGEAEWEMEAAAGGSDGLGTGRARTRGAPAPPRSRLPAAGPKATPPLSAYGWLRAHQPAPPLPGCERAPAARTEHGAACGGACALKLISLDLQPSWEAYVAELGRQTAGWASAAVSSSYAFVQADLTRMLRAGGLRAHVSAALGEATDDGGEPIDLCLISNVLIYCSDEPTVRTPLHRAAAAPCRRCAAR